jgi:glycosyltransferase involved in cell wall biosynthesis
MAVPVSVIICTRDRAESVRNTLEAIAKCRIPSGVQAELIVVDNASTDETPRFLGGLDRRLGAIEVTTLTEPRRGKSWALNRALAVARGDVVLFTDDDVLPPVDWIAGMCGPIWDGEADAVAGGLKLGPRIDATGIGPAQRAWLATTEQCERPDDPPLVGANMAIARHVFDKVPWFDPEVGPGAIGHAEDTLFWLQVRAAKFRIVSRYNVIAEHNPDPSRTTWRAMAKLAEKHGEFAAYVDYHWNRVERRHPFIALGVTGLKLWRARLRHLSSWLQAQTIPAWEMEPLEDYFFRRHLLVERKRPPNFDSHGLVKRAGVLPDRTSASIESPILLAG